MKLHLTGGKVRDHLLKMDTSKADLDFAVEANSFDEMLEGLVARGLMVWQSRPEFVTVRGQVPRAALGNFGGLLPPLSDHERRTARVMVPADFTLCRAETMYSDGRHPDKVTPADLVTDLKRRDFTVNAVAVSEDGLWTDPFDGSVHCANRHLRTVGNPWDRFTEDPLRMLRAWRFAVTRQLTVANSLVESLHPCAKLLTRDVVSVERVRDELHKGLKHNWYLGMSWLTGMPFYAVGAQVAHEFPELWVRPTLEDK